MTETQDKAGQAGREPPAQATVGRVILGPDCVAEGAVYLSTIDQRFSNALHQTGPLPLRLRKDGFPALLGAIVSQQVSVAAADAIWGRLEAAGLIGPRKIKAASDDDLRACGLSRQKMRYARALAEAGIRYPRLRDLPTEDVIVTLTEVPGIGKWTAEIYAMFSLGRADVFAPGDLALQESARILFDLPERPTEKVLRNMAEDWSPWRAVAARLLWAYYRVAKEREGIR
ncbi:MAG: DNA-3-methyladenine glycosylase 2 family protein [Silicimonas sp.]|nr:DNA-3-methyladenine glycosylase 2 family protein [Silicimonas sp.]MBT8424632.1 DNA-3-methyladenine glycosylase 2 family protein [Silicimonas sp.]